MGKMRTKTIGIDARFYGEAGPGRYVKNIISHLERVDNHNKYVLFLREEGFSTYQPRNSNFSKVLADYKWYSWEEQIGFLFEILKCRLDLLYVPHFNVPVLYPGILVTAIPDLIMHSYSTEKGTTLPKPYFKFKKFVYKIVVLWAVIRSKRVLVPSNDVLNDFLKAFPFISRSKYIVAYEGVDPSYENVTPDPDEVLRKYRVKKPFLLYVSSMYEHKNVSGLIEMFKILISRFGYKGQMVLIGKRDRFSTEVQKRIIGEDLSGRILMPGMDTYVTDPEVASFRAEADAYVFPSFKEGFSLTPLEAMSVGLVCVISDIPCHREIYGDSVLYFNPADPNDIAKKVNLVITNRDLRESLIKKGYERVKKYDWMETAKITLDVFENV